MKESTTNGLVMPLAGQSVLPQSLAFRTSEITELADVYFFHPLGSVVARLAKFLGLTPTQVTVISALVGVAGGALLYDENLGLLAFAILILHGIIDAADGQLARLTGQVTELGKVLDGGAGYLTHTAIYLAIATGELHRNGGSLIFLWMALAGISTALHARMYDYHRTQYTSIVSKGVLPRQDPTQVASWLRELYRGYLSMQGFLIGSHARVDTALARRSVGGVVQPEDRMRYRDHFYAPARGWNFLGDNTRFYAIGALALFHRIDLYFAFVLLPMNLALLLLWFWQRRTDQRFLAGL